MLQRLLLAIGSVVVGGTADALRLPSFISSDMVLQRGRATLWGWAHANATVTVTVRSSAIDGPSEARHATIAANVRRDTCGGVWRSMECIRERTYAGGNLGPHILLPGRTGGKGMGRGAEGQC